MMPTDEARTSGRVAALDPPRGPRSSSDRALARIRRWLTPGRWMIVAIVVFFVVAFLLSWLRAVEFQTTTWDEGLYQQALWSTAHGRPFYETADVETGGYGSLLQVHSVFLFFLLAPLYGLLPSQATLFAVQSAVVALAAAPLFLLARDRTSSPRWGLVAGVVYLAWTPVLSSTLYDFHPEAFLPLELFTLALVWQRGRYGVGLLVAFVAFTTLEIAPVLTFFLAVLVLIGGVAPAERRATSPKPLRFFARPVAVLREWIRAPRVRFSLVLLVASAVAYGVLLYLRVDYLTSVLGASSLSQAPTGYVIGASPAALGLSWSNLSVGFGSKLTYWVLALALLGFVPLLAPRALVVSAPWFAFTMFSSNLNYVTLGFQYGFIAASSLLVAFAYALPEARRVAGALLRESRAAGPSTRTERRRLSRRRFALVGGLALLIAINLALTPLDPLLQNSGLGSAYRLSYDPGPGGEDVRELVALVPATGTIVASDDLFPLVANDENAYSFLWTRDPTLALPFDPEHPPPWVLLAENRLVAVPSWLASLLYTPAVFGVRGVVWSSEVGTVLLFEAGYSGAPTIFGPEPGFGGSYYGGALATGLDGLVATVPGSTYPSVVESAAGSEGTLWEGPNASLASGRYAVDLSLRVQPLPGYPVPNASLPVLTVASSAFALPSIVSGSWDFGTLDSPTWITLAFNVTLAEPTLEFTVQGVQLVSSVETTLNYLAIDPAGPSGGDLG